MSIYQFCKMLIIELTHISIAKTNIQFVSVLCVFEVPSRKAALNLSRHFSTTLTQWNLLSGTRKVLVVHSCLHFHLHLEYGGGCAYPNGSVLIILIKFLYFLVDLFYCVVGLILSLNNAVVSAVLHCFGSPIIIPAVHLQTKWSGCCFFLIQCYVFAGETIPQN